MILRCYHCGYDGLTRVELIDGVGVWATCIVCCLFALWPCALCTLCIDGLKDIHHYCASCHTLIAQRKKC